MKIVSCSSCRKSAILKYFCPLILLLVHTKKNAQLSLVPCQIHFIEPGNHRLNGKQCRSLSNGFFRSQLIRIYTVFKSGYIQIKQCMTYAFLLTNLISEQACTPFLGAYTLCAKRIVCGSYQLCNTGSYHLCTS